MDWASVRDDTAGMGYGERWTYLVTADMSADGEEVTAVRLSRYSTQVIPRVSEAALDAAANAIIFPMGRGGGRPGGLLALEIASLMEMAKAYAERFEAGESLEGYPAWQHRRRVLRDAVGGSVFEGGSDGCASC
jgi:hypothetical protein